MSHLIYADTKFENLKLQKRSFFTTHVPTALLPDRGEVIKIGDNFSNPFKTSLTYCCKGGSPNTFFDRKKTFLINRTLNLTQKQLWCRQKVCFYIKYQVSKKYFMSKYFDSRWCRLWSHFLKCSTKFAKYFLDFQGYSPIPICSRKLKTITSRLLS